MLNPRDLNLVEISTWLRSQPGRDLNLVEISTRLNPRDLNLVEISTLLRSQPGWTGQIPIFSIQRTGLFPMLVWTGSVFIFTEITEYIYFSLMLTPVNFEYQSG